MEMMRNPHAREQAMRSQDLMMSQLENHPRGFDALRRMQEDIADPMAEAAANASAAANTTRSTPTPATLQNPWAQPSSTTPNPWGGMGGAGSAAGMGGMNMADMMGQMGGMSGAGAAAGMGGMPAMDPNQMAALMNNPMMQQQMQMMLNDPAMIQQMTAMNPQLGPMLQNPQVRAMLSNPALMQQMMNPANMQVSKLRMHISCVLLGCMQ